MTNSKTLVVALLLLVALAAPPASAQTPYIGVFWDNKGTHEDTIPPGVIGLVDSLFIIGYNLNCTVRGAEFKVEYPNCIGFIADVGTPPVTFGITPVGISMSFPALLSPNGFFPVRFVKVIFQWNCTTCALIDVPVRVVGHPLFNPANPQYTCLFIPALFPAVGLTALICPTVPVEETTWGRVKSLYAQ